MLSKNSKVTLELWGSKFAVSHRFGQIDEKMAKSMERGKFRPHAAPKLLNRFFKYKIRTSELPPEEDQTLCKISFRSDHVGGLGKYAA